MGKYDEIAERAVENYGIVTASEAVALVGEGAWLCGDSVLAMHNLALVNPPCVYVATTKRVRRTLPEWIRVGKATLEGAGEWQPVTDENKAGMRFFRVDVVLP